MHARIRRLQAGDATEFRSLRLRGLREHPEAFTSSHEEDQKLPMADTVRRLQSGELHFWGAFEGASLRAIVGLRREQRTKNHHKATVVGLYVAPEAGRSGIGRALVDAVVDEAHAIGIALLVLTVTEGNTTATRLYESAGFRSFGVEPDAIRVGGRSFAKIHMALRLGPA